MFKNFIYNDIEYNFFYNENDSSSLGCIQEIVVRDDYKLKDYINIQDGVFIDIGANCGVATIILAKQNLNSIIYSFEPDPKVYEILKKNIDINNLKNVKHFNKAVLNNNIKNVNLYFHPMFSGGNTTVTEQEIFDNFFKTNTKNISVECTSIDNIIKDNNIKSIELLKIDCEGAEFDILYGSDMFKKGIIKNIVGEFHDLCYNKTYSKSIDLIEYCKNNIKGNINISILKI